MYPLHIRHNLEDSVTLIDFDGTITVIHPREENPTSFDALFLNDDVEDEIKKEYLQRRALDLPNKEHWKVALELGIGLKYDNFRIAAERLNPREGSLDFLAKLYYEKRSFYIVSAGIGNVINAFFEAYINDSSLLKYIKNHTLANYYSFGRNLVITGVNSPIIHDKNKGNFFLGHKVLDDELGDKMAKSLIIGDSINDALIDLNAKKVGICDWRHLSQSEILKMKEVYDVLILDGTFNFLNDE